MVLLGVVCRCDMIVGLIDLIDFLAGRLNLYYKIDADCFAASPYLELLWQEGSIPSVIKPYIRSTILLLFPKKVNILEGAAFSGP